jgi:hypothetical protein
MRTTVPVPAAIGCLLLGAAALPAGCEQPAPAGATVAASPLTYWGDVAPILNRACVKCHQEGGVAPFRLDDHSEAARFAVAAADATRAGIMPPYLVTHDGSCGQFQDEETLTAEERGKIWDWAHGDRKEGARVSLPRPAPPSIGPAQEWKTPALMPVADGTQVAEFDEYRCIAFESNLAQDRFITAYEVAPGTPALVHHVLAFLVDPARVTASGKSNAEVMAALDRTDGDRPGWPCLGLAGEGVEFDSMPVIWAPGQGPVVYPEGIGLSHRRTHTLVVQLHYNVADRRLHGLSDSTTVRFRHLDSVKRRGLFLIRDGFLDTLFLPGGPASLAPGRRTTTFTWRRSGKEIGVDPFPYVDVVGVMPHMHTRGVRKQMSIGPAGGEMACAARVERWNFHWQKFYFYDGVPPRLTGSSQIELTCEYDTSADRLPIQPGWGTTNEMCNAILMVALPEGA